MSIQVRLPENLQIIIELQNQGSGTIVKINSHIWMVLGKQPNKETYGYQLMDPNTHQRGPYTGNLTKEQVSKLINKLIKKPGFGFGKEEIDIKKHINQLIKNIKTYELQQARRRNEGNRP